MFLSAEGEGFVPPSSNDFELPPIFGDNPFTTKPIFLVFLSVILVSVFFILSSRKAAIVPSKFQFAGESIYAFVRNDLARDVIGHEFMRSFSARTLGRRSAGNLMRKSPACEIGN